MLYLVALDRGDSNHVDLQYGLVTAEGNDMLGTMYVDSSQRVIFPPQRYGIIGACHPELHVRRGIEVGR